MSLLDLPTELLLEIIGYLVPYNEHRPIVGIDAGWRTLGDYRDSLTVLETRNEQSEGNEKFKVSIYSSLTALRS